MVGDFLALYGLDPFTMIWVPNTQSVEALIRRLRFEERSLWRARRLGGEEHFGWSIDRMILAVIANAANTRNKGKALRERERIQAPKVVERGEKPKKRGGRVNWGAMVPPSMRDE